MKVAFLIFLLTVVIACSNNQSKAVNDIPMLANNIRAFITTKKCFNESRNILVVNLSVKNDTLYLDIADTYPNIRGMKFNLDTTMFGIRTLFTGEKIKGYSKDSSNNSFPLDIVEINKNQKWLLEKEFTGWLFVYHHGSLIRKSPGCNEDK